MSAAEMNRATMEDPRWENITPKRAETYLNQNRSNRKLREGVAEKYAEDMKAGRWTACIDPIAFYEDGDIADGQHRLWAIIESGVPQKFLVLRGVPREAGLNIDTGLPRTLVDNARISGADTELSNMLISVTRAIEHGERGKGSLSNAERVEIVRKHREAGQWVIQNGPHGKFFRNAVVLGAIGRAYYHEEDRNRLRHFGEVLSNGFSNGDEDSAAVAMRNYLLAKGTQASISSQWRDTFLKVQNAARYFMLARSLTTIKRISDEAYPLRGSKKPQSLARGKKKKRE